MPCSINEFIAENSFKLKNITDTPRKELELFISHILGIDPLYVKINDDRILEDSQIEKLRIMVDKRVESYPFEYIMGKASFYSEEFLVEEGGFNTKTGNGAFNR